ncbi:MAG TPA: LysM peptidoglycan-binding domain-containing protein [Candidatus Goldiibacteriota bacterium]|nr:LysM peptidoglycan-binding domain-containing protein [Candidatus Goldiibacteriota bacterium]
MKKNFLISLAGLLIFNILFFNGCGGTSQKISSAADEESQVMEEAKASAREALPSTYIVEDGDTLWSIAKKPEIYGNKYQWPLIYDANRDILDSYNSPLQEGQKLIIPRNVSALEIETAKERAKELGIPDTGEKVKVASVRKTSEYEDEQNKKIKSASKSKQMEQSYEEENWTEEEPTPISEPVKSQKKGKINIMPLFLIVLGVLLLIIFFIFSRQKKEEEDEEDKEGESKSNIL